MPRTRLSKDALADIEAIGDYMSTKDPEAAFRTVLRIKATIRKLRDFPEMGAPRYQAGDFIRSLPGQGFVVYYIYTGNECVILRVFHSAADSPWSPRHGGSR